MLDKKSKSNLITPQRARIDIVEIEEVTKTKKVSDANNSI
jgi:hypothetical protein